ncbi:MAG: MFS transporter [Synergistes sp.]|nr:MFS transporter [Synergistes sp.]
MKLNRKYLIILTVYAIISAVVVMVDWQFLLTNPFRIKISTDNPYYASCMPGGGSAVITNGLKRVLCYDERGRICGIINGGNRADSAFFYATCVVVADKHILVLDTSFKDNDMYPDVERILAFDLNGRYERTLFEVSYRNNDIPIEERQKYHIYNIDYYNGDVYFVERSANSFYLYKISGGAELPLLLRVIEAPEISRTLRVAYNGKSDEIWFTAHDGCVYKEKNGGFVKMFDGDKHNGSSILGITCCDDGSVVCTDSGTKKLIKLFPENKIITHVAKNMDRGYYYSVVSSSGNLLSLVYHDSVYTLNADGSGMKAIGTAFCTPRFIAERFVVWFSVIYLALFLIAMSAICVNNILSGNRSREFKTALKVAIVMILTATVVSAYILTSLFFFHEKNIFDVTTMLTEILADTSGKVYGDSFERLKSLSDYGNNDYANVRKNLDFVCEDNEDLIMTLYYTTGKVSENTFYYISSHKNETGINVPAYSKKSSPEFWDAIHGNIVKFKNTKDNLGTWSGAMAPIYNSKGKAVGILEVGYDVVGYGKEIRKIIINISYALLVFLVGILLVFAEITPFVECISKRRLAIQASSNELRPAILEVSRTMTFAAFFIESLPTVFIVQQASKLFASSPVGIIPVEFAPALPLSLMTFFAPRATNVGGFMAERFGFRKNALAGAFILILSSCICAAAFRFSNYAVLLCGFAISGIGIGLCNPNCLSAFAEKENERMRLFVSNTTGMTSGILLGASVGGFVADAAGLATVFAVQSIAAVFIILLAAMFLNGTIGKVEILDGTEREARLSSFRFLLNPQIIFVICCAIFPTCLFAAYRTFLFPMYAAHEDLGSIQIGNMILLAGALSVFMAGPLSSFISRRINLQRIVAFMSILMACCFIVFSYFTNVTSSVMVLFIAILFVSINNIAISTYYISMDIVRDYGKTKSMGQFAQLTATCNSASLLIFSIAAGKIGMSYGTAAVGVAAAVLSVIFSLFVDRVVVKFGRKHKSVAM